MKTTLLFSILATLPFLCTPVDPVAAGAGNREATAAFAPYQGRLLDLAFQAASALPIAPHLKTRSAKQQEVLDTCLQLDQPGRVLRDAEQIANWRRGAVLADYAGYRARHGASRKDLQGLIDRAERIARQAVLEGSGQRWRGDRIRAKLAQLSLVLGEEEQVARYVDGIEDAEYGRVSVTRAEVLDPADFGDELDRLAAVIDGGVFDQVRGALASGARLYSRFYEDASRRTAIWETLGPARDSISRQIWIELLHELTRSALDHHDQRQARTLLDLAAAVADDVDWLPEHEIALLAAGAGLRHRAGDIERAESLARQALALFQAQRQRIIDIYRAEALLPLAESYQLMGRQAAALTVYRNALLEGTRNPNARPRAEDIVTICCSMALHQIEPDPTLWEQLTSAVRDLGTPW